MDKTEGLIQELAVRLQQLDEDLSQNNPQVFAEFSNAPSEMYAHMEMRFNELRRVAYAETDQDWYKEYISMMKDLMAHFQNHLKCQYKVTPALIHDPFAKTRTNYLHTFIGSTTIETEDRLPDQEHAFGDGKVS